MNQRPLCERDIFTRYGPQVRAVLDARLDKYIAEDVINLDGSNVLSIAPVTAMGSVVQLVKARGGKVAFEEAVRGLQDAIYNQTGHLGSQ